MFVAGDLKQFQRVGHCLFALLAALVGSGIARWFHRSNLEPAGVVEAQQTMSDAPAASPAILLAMTAVTGVVDAVSFLAMGHVFTANMTGNIVLLGFALAGAAGLSVSRSSVALTAFLVEASLLALSAALAIIYPLQPYAVIASTGVAMGLRNAVVRKLGVADLTTTVLTLTITGLAADSRLAGGDSPRWQRRSVAIVAMLAGASAGALMVIRSIWLPLAVCSVITAGCAIAHMHINSKRRQL